MSQQLAVCLVAVAANLVGVLIIYSVMAQTLARLALRGRGIFGAIAIIIIAQLFWIAPAQLIVVPRDPEGASSYALWFGNWIVSGFGVVLFSQRVKNIPRSLEDSARSDGLGAFGIWRHVIFPFVRRELGLLAIFTVMATLLPFWAFINQPAASGISIFQRSSTFAQHLSMMTAGSLLGALPLIAMLLLAKRREVS
jgi:ABC-type glycerol-3-phosphate transport system permease component